MTKIKRYLLGVLIILTLSLGGIFSAYQYRIALAHWVLDYVAEQYGFSDKRLRIEEFDFETLKLKDIWLGPDLSIAELQLDFSPPALLKGRADHLNITGVTIDITAPNTGALGRLQSLYDLQARVTTSKEIGQIPPLPQTIITDMRVFGTYNGGTVDFITNGNLRSDASGQFTSKGFAAFEDITVQDIQLTTTLSKQADQFAINLINASLTHQGVPALFTPVKLNGNIRYQNDDVTLSLNAQDITERLSLDITGKADILKQSAALKFNIATLQFSPDIFQPKDLLPKAVLPFPIDANVAVSGDMTWKDMTPHILAKISVKDTHAVFDQAELTQMMLNGDIYLDILPLDQRMDISIPDLKLHHAAPSPLFNPLRLKTTAQLKDDLISSETLAFLDKNKDQKILTVTAQHSLSTEVGNADIEVQNLRFSKTGLHLSDFTPFLDIIEETTGRIKAQSFVKWDKDGLKTKASVQLSDLSLKSDTISLNRINSTLDFSNLLPLETSARQTVKLEEISSGFSLGRPHLVFSLKKAIPYLHEFKADFIGGHISVKDMLLDPNRKKQDVTLHLAKLDLQNLFSLIELDGLAGTGTLSGKIPISIANNDIIITDAILNSDAPGTLRFTSQKAQQALAGAGQQVDLLLRVLSNFHYKKLSLKINREPDHNAVVNLHISGANPTVMDARPFNLNINLEGNIDRLLDTIMEGYRLSDRAIRATVDSEQ